MSTCGGPPMSGGALPALSPNPVKGGRTRKATWRYIRGMKIRIPKKRRQTRKGKPTLRKSLRKR